ncbi:hypothetical protein [Novosphingobium mangrovi (ex Huang et al. 2023)]|uniref:Uncharacterized protein n=1 Tax=Novosphingobium mangrovi (ex Huang et al. 2023) TaxID=2976432 RepID=A0ABT2I757_9SPHN|nr:hypothetical protein [Novosphingobium mangrovi (ex Huang et al. 2023)]MCT2400652.1 hypothetical protein [Novosphingobium mangrovi (ex Huang et al. 2023)]
MNLASALLYPIAMLLPAAGAIDSDSRGNEVMVQAVPSGEDGQAYAWPRVAPQAVAPGWSVRMRMLRDVEPEPAWQVHIEQRMQIRITPRAPARMPPDMYVGIPEGDISVQFTERKMGKCLPVSGIAGVQPDRGSRLLLYMRDRRLVVAELERSCRARDFYSGFYLAKTRDGQLCVDRDRLLSRSGMNCKLTRIRQLVRRER